MRLRRVLIAFGGVIAAWLIAMVIVGAVYGDRIAARVTERLGESLQATATVGGADLAMIRGRLELDQLAVRKEDVGRLALDVDNVRCELAPLGVALFDGECRELAVRGVRLEVTNAAVFVIRKPKRTPIRAEHLTLDDAVLEFAPNAVVPNLGRIEIRVDHAEAGPTVYKTPLSWLFALRELRARVVLPARVTVQLTYAGGVLSASGTLFGSTPVSIHVELPAPHGDARDEVRQLVETGLDFGARLVARRAEDWIRSKVRL
jgi:hypothetical protein